MKQNKLEKNSNEPQSYEEMCQSITAKRTRDGRARNIFERDFERRYGGKPLNM